MKYRRSLMISLALVLTAMLLLGGAALAQQNRGGGPGVCPGSQGNQLCTGGPGGTCEVNPANDPVPQQNCPGNNAGQCWRQKGPKRGGPGQSGQPNSPANPPATSQ